MGSANSSRAGTDNRSKTRSAAVRIPEIETTPPHSIEENTNEENPNKVPSKPSANNSLSPHGQKLTYEISKEDQRKPEASSGKNGKERVDNGQASTSKPHWSAFVDQSHFIGANKGSSSHLSKSESNLADYDTENSIDENKTRSGSQLSKPVTPSTDADNDKIASDANSETGELRVEKGTVKRKESSANDTRQQHAFEINALAQSKKRLSNDIGKPTIVNIKRRMSESEIVAVDVTAHYNNPVNELDPEICHNEGDLEHLIESDNHVKGYSSDDFIAADLTHYSNPLSRALSTGYH